jgi:hypothetical protein
MICHPVCHGSVGVNTNWGKTHILLQVQENGTNWVQQARASLTVEQTEALIQDLQHRIEEVRKGRNNDEA